MSGVSMRKRSACKTAAAILHHFCIPSVPVLHLSNASPHLIPIVFPPPIRRLHRCPVVFLSLSPFITTPSPPSSICSISPTLPFFPFLLSSFSPCRPSPCLLSSLSSFLLSLRLGLRPSLPPLSSVVSFTTSPHLSLSPPPSPPPLSLPFSSPRCDPLPPLFPRYALPVQSHLRPPSFPLPAWPPRVHVCPGAASIHDPLLSFRPDPDALLALW
ncbi:hypothetical protein C8R44DRAFT_794719 [Mycena epipterygia]|nr:hypothetical protein C8R44DRAFT_794719 [Mycena epipterygia]